jgi:hypothetical protein
MRGQCLFYIYWDDYGFYLSIFYLFLLFLFYSTYFGGIGAWAQLSFLFGWVLAVLGFEPQVSCLIDRCCMACAMTSTLFGCLNFSFVESNVESLFLYYIYLIYFIYFFLPFMMIFIMKKVITLRFFFLEIGSCYFAQVGFELNTLLLPPPEC